MCQCLKVSRSCYYEWRRGGISQRAAEDEVLGKLLAEELKRSRMTYWTRRLKRILARQGLVVSRRRISRLLSAMGLSCKMKRKYKATTDSRHQLLVAANVLNRAFEASRPGEKYVGDITYIWTLEGWLYLAVVLDLYSRKVVGWSMSHGMKAELVNDALLMAIWRRKPNPGLLWHTDRGSQYAADSHRQLLKAHGIDQSMSRKGNCWDNAVSESFFHTLKTELIHDQIFATREHAKQALFEYIEVFYNQMRLHSANDYLSPAEFEAIRKTG